MVSFIDKLKAMKLTKFSFTSFDQTMASAKEGEERVKILILNLDTPIEKVTSSVSKSNPDNWEERRYPVKTDVTEIRVNLNLIEKFSDEWVFDELNGELVGSGSYNGDLFLDLSSAGDVWLTDMKFSKWKSDKGKESRRVEWSKMFGE